MSMLIINDFQGFLKMSYFYNSQNTVQVYPLALHSRHTRGQNYSLLWPFYLYLFIKAIDSGVKLTDSIYFYKQMSWRV